MRQSLLLLPTLKEDPADADIISHKLMLRTGMIRQLASGLYTWLPLGLRVLRKIEHIIREEMNRSGAQEVSMPVVQPAELWIETGRWQKMGDEMMRLQDRHKRDFLFGANPRRGHHRSVSTRSAQLSPATREFLPNSNKVSRRTAASLWRHART